MILLTSPTHLHLKLRKLHVVKDPEDNLKEVLPPRLVEEVAVRLHDLKHHRQSPREEGRRGGGEEGRRGGGEEGRRGGGEEGRRGGGEEEREKERGGRKGRGEGEVPSNNSVCSNAFCFEPSKDAFNCWQNGLTFNK